MASETRRDNGRGINRKASKTKIPQGFVEDMVNARPHKSGQIATREGTRSHAGLTPSGASYPVRGAAIYRSAAEEYPVLVANGKVYARSTTASAATTVDLKAVGTVAFSVGPAFHPDTVLNATVRRFGGAVSATNVVGNAAVVTSATYNSTLGQATYILNLAGYAWVSYTTLPTLISQVIKTTAGTKADWATFTQMGYAEYNGTFEIVTVSSSPSGSDLIVTLVVSNSTGTAETPADSASFGYCEITTNVVTGLTNSNMIATDTVSTIYNTSTAATYTVSGTLSVRGVSGTTFAFNITEDEYVVGPNTRLNGSRTSTVVPVVSSTGKVAGDVLNITGYNRGISVASVSSPNITLIESVSFTHANAVTEPYNWVQSDIPGGTGDLVVQPTAAQLFSGAPTARVRTATIQDSVFMTNGTDSVMKYDGTNVYRAGLPNWDPELTLYVNPDYGGIPLDSVIATQVVGTLPTNDAETARTVTFGSGYDNLVGKYIVDSRSGIRYSVVGYDSLTNTASLGTLTERLAPLSFTFVDADVTPASDTIAKYFNPPKGTRVRFSTTGVLPAGLATNTDYYTIQSNNYSSFQVSARDPLTPNPDTDPSLSSPVDITAAAGGGTHTCTCQENAFYIPKKYSYYIKLTAIDANSNKQSSAVIGYGTSIIDVNSPGTIILSLITPPAFDNYAYNRLELEVYRTKDLVEDPSGLTHYRLRNIPLTFNATDHRINVIDATPDSSLSELDSVSTSVKSENLPTEASPPPRSKYIGAAANRLVVANIKTDPTLELTLTRTTSLQVEDVNALSGSTIAIADATSAQTFTASFISRDAESFIRFGEGAFVNNAGTLEVSGTSIGGLYVTDYILANETLQFTMKAGQTAPTNLTADTTYYIQNTAGAGAAGRLRLSLTYGGAAIAYVSGAGQTCYIAGSPIASMNNSDAKVQTLGGISVGGYEDSHQISNSGGHVLVTMSRELESAPVKLNDRVKFYPYVSTYSGAPTPTGAFHTVVAADTVYYAIPISTTVPSTFKLSLTENGSAIAYSGAVAHGMIEFMDAFYVNFHREIPGIETAAAGGTSTACAVTLQLESVSFNDLVWGPVTSAPLSLGILTNGESAQSEAPIMSRFMGWWKTSHIMHSGATPRLTIARIAYKHGVSLNPATNHSYIGVENSYSGYDEWTSTLISGINPQAPLETAGRLHHQVLMTIETAASTSYPIVCTTGKFVRRHLYKSNWAEDGDIVYGMHSLAAAFNTYQRSLPIPWGYAQWIGRTVTIIGAKPTTVLSTTVTKGNSEWFASYVNGVSATSGAGVTRLFPSRLIRSYTNFPEIFDKPFADSNVTSDSVIDINAADGQDITGLGTFFGASFSAASGGSVKEDIVVVAKNASIYAVNVRSAEVRKIESHGKGCTAPDSMVSTPGGIMFACESGIYRVRPDLQVDYPGEAIEGLWKTVNKDYLSLATAVMDPHDRVYKIAVPTGTSTINNEVFCYDYDRDGVDQPYGAWYRTDLSGITCWAVSSTNTFTGTTGGDFTQVRRDRDTDGGDYQEADATAIPVSVVFPTEDFGDAGLKKRVRKFLVDLDLDGTNVTDLTVYQSANTEDLWRDCGNADVTRSNTSSLAHQQEPTIAYSPPVRSCYRTQFKVEHEVVKEQLIISGITYKVDAESDRGSRENVDANPGS